MKKIVLVVIALCLAAGFIFTREAAFAKNESSSVTLVFGTIIDNSCADTHKGDIAEFIKTHPKSCALMPDCVASGYSIYADGKLTKFDRESSAKIEEFLKKSDSKLEVAIEVERAGSELKLVSIKNNKA